MSSVRILVIALVVSTYLPGVQAFGQTGNVSPTTDPAQQRAQEELTKAQAELAKAQKKVAEAQEVNYHEQNRKLSEQNLFRKIQDEPATILAIIGTFSAAITFFLNYRAQQRIQRDNTFYESLKRFGDKDSSSLRASAAGLLAQMGHEKVGIIFRQRPYLTTTIDQLMTGSLLEKDSTVLLAIESSIRQLVQRYFLRVISPLAAANRTLQVSFVQALARFLASKGVTDVAGTDLHWITAERITSYRSGILSALALKGDNREVFSEALTLASAEMQALIDADAEKQAFVAQASIELRLATARLVSNVRLLEVALPLLRRRRRLIFVTQTALIRLLYRLFRVRMRKAIRRLHVSSPLYPRVMQHLERLRRREHWGWLNLSGIFIAETKLHRLKLNRVSLARANLMYADLSAARLERIDLTEANMERAVLSDADIRFALLLETRMPHASLERARVSGSTLWRVDVSQARWFGLYLQNLFPSILLETEWWKADFSPPEGKGGTDDWRPLSFQKALTNRLLQRLRTEWGKDMPLELGLVHPSVASAFEQDAGRD